MLYVCVCACIYRNSCSLITCDPLFLLQLLEKAVLCRTSQDFGMENVKQVHAKIQEEIANSQAKTTRILEEHEKVSANGV